MRAIRHHGTRVGGSGEKQQRRGIGHPDGGSSAFHRIRMARAGQQRDGEGHGGWQPVALDVAGGDEQQRD
jgi:hypothetical protein